MEVDELEVYRNARDEGTKNYIRSFFKLVEFGEVWEKPAEDGILYTKLVTWGKGRYATIWVVKKDGKVVRSGVKWGVGSASGFGVTAMRTLNEIFEKELQDLEEHTP
jgi:hypothetical protein